MENVSCKTCKIKSQKVLFEAVYFNSNVNSMLFLCKNNTDSLSVAPVKFPVVQISIKLNMNKKYRGNRRQYINLGEEGK